MQRDVSAKVFVSMSTYFVGGQGLAAGRAARREGEVIRPLPDAKIDDCIKQCLYAFVLKRRTGKHWNDRVPEVFCGK